MVYNGTELSAKNEITGFGEYEKQGYRYENLVVSGSRTEVGISVSQIESIVIYDPEGNVVTDMFELKTGIVHVYYWEISASSADANFVYGEMGGREVVIGGEGIQPGHTWSCNFTSNYSAGEHTNIFTMAIFDENGKDITYCYKINASYGLLNIAHRAITVTAQSATQKYNGEYLTCAKYTMQGTLAENHYVRVCTIEGAQKNVGHCDNVISEFIICDADGNNVTKNYSITMEKGILRVTRN